jgi:predicted nucleic acid-binding protein
MSLLLCSHHSNARDGYQYSDNQLDFTDAAIVAIAERLDITRVYTLDRRDFSIIRPSHCNYFELLP